MLLLMAAMMPESKIIEELTEACNEYKLVPTEDNKMKIVVSCTLLMTKASMKKDGVEGYMEAKGEFESFSKKMKLFETPTN